MNETSLRILGFAAGIVIAAPVFSSNAEVEAAIGLMKQAHADLCQKKKIQSQLLLAHQSHDQDKLSKFGSELDAINQRLKPTEDKLNALKATIRKKPEDASAFDSAQLQLGDCE